MASTSASSHPTATKEAPWKPLFLEHISKLGSSPEFSLATVSASSNTSSSLPIPRVRTCIHRGFFASPLPENKHNDHTPNPHVYDSDCPAFTTDARMSKTYDIFNTGKGQGSIEQSMSGTGGGGYVEACYWVKDVMTQWRVLGKCWILAADDIEPQDPATGDAAQNSGTLTVKAELGRYMRPATDAKGQGDQGNKGDWSWKREVEMHFANLSPTMKGSFKNPPPGIPQKQASNGGSTAGPGEKLGQKAGYLEDEPLARKNFRIAVIAPEEVEKVDLTDPDNSTRVKWTLRRGGGASVRSGLLQEERGAAEPERKDEWDEVELWP